MRKLVLGLIPLIVIAGGCAVTGSTGKKFDTSAVSSIKNGVTTKQQVLDRLGPPRTKNVAIGGSEMWTYQFTTTTGEVGAIDFVPIVGTLTPNARSSTSDTVTIQFRGDTVADCTYSSMRTVGKASYMGVYDPQSTENRTTRCSSISSTQTKEHGTSREQVYEAQMLLNKHGYSAGTPDGVMGPATRNAIMQFQKEHGMAVNGNVSEPLLANLRSL